MFFIYFDGPVILVSTLNTAPGTENGASNRNQRFTMCWALLKEGKKVRLAAQGQKGKGGIRWDASF